jgi:hypothetical protein
MSTFSRYVPIVLVGLTLSLACSGGSEPGGSDAGPGPGGSDAGLGPGGSDAGPGPGGSDAGGSSGHALPNDAPRLYNKTCTQSACDTCREDSFSDCHECTRICSNSSAPADCFSTCSNICGSSCPVCSKPEICEEWRYTVPLPKLDENVFEACLAYDRACPLAVAYPQSACHFYARAYRPEVAGEIACLTQRGCDDAGCLVLPVTARTLATDLCQREAGCGKPCSHSFEGDSEDVLRPELVQGLRACIAEPSCNEFSACEKAYMDLAGLWYANPEHVGNVRAINEDPVAHADDPKWGQECYGAAACGNFDCVKGSCDVCDSYCVRACRTDADCIGQFVGTLLTPHCFTLGADLGGCSTF